MKKFLWILGSLVFILFAIIIVLIIATAVEEAAKKAQEKNGFGNLNAEASPVAIEEIGADLIQIYKNGASHCPNLPWTVVAAIGKQETDHGTNGGDGQARTRDPVTNVVSPQIVSDAGAIGPMQHMDSSWADFGANGDEDSPGDPNYANRNDYDDAVVATANHLCRGKTLGDGSRENLVRVLRRYYSGNENEQRDSYLGTNTVYAEEVLEQAALYSATGDIQSIGDGTLSWPLAEFYVASPFGMRIHPILGYPKMHTGLDMCPTDQLNCRRAEVKSAGPGIVTFAEYFGSAGNKVTVDHGGGITTNYLHLDEFKVQVGQQVSKGTVVGLIGTTGGSTGDHLHFETRINDEPVDPYTQIGQPTSDKM